MRITTPIRLGVFAAVILLAACTTPRQAPLPLGNLKIGTAYYTQPQRNADMLAGYLPDKLAPVDKTVLAALDVQLAEVLRTKSKNNFISSVEAERCARNLSSATPQAALRTWSAIGRCMGVDLIVVPQIIEWRERNGGDAGVATPSSVVMDTFVIDVNNEALISRSRYDETQSALADNLLEAGKFIKRGGKWISAREMAREGMEKAVRDLGL